MNATPIILNERIVAVVAAKTLFRAMSARRGMMRYPYLGIAFDIDALRQATKAQAERIVVFNRDDGSTYETSMEQFRKQGERNPMNAEQWMMKLTLWKRRDRGEEDQELPEELARCDWGDEPQRREDPIEAARKAIVATGSARGRIDCPICKCSGTLAFAVAQSNGHVSASCGTDGCVRWME
jgi:hypothetical protein